MGDPGNEDAAHCFMASIVSLVVRSRLHERGVASELDGALILSRSLSASESAVCPPQRQQGLHMSVHQTGQSDGDDVYPDGFRSAIVSPKSARHCKSVLFKFSRPERSSWRDRWFDADSEQVCTIGKTARASHSALVSSVHKALQTVWL